MQILEGGGSRGTPANVGLNLLIRSYLTPRQGRSHLSLWPPALTVYTTQSNSVQQYSSRTVEHHNYIKCTRLPQLFSLLVISRRRGRHHYQPGPEQIVADSQTVVTMSNDGTHTAQSTHLIDGNSSDSARGPK